MSKTFTDKETDIIYYELPKPYDAKFLIVAAENGKVVEINHFGSFKDAKHNKKKGD